VVVALIPSPIVGEGRVRTILYLLVIEIDANIKNRKKTIQIDAKVPTQK
jgi:hypothetical protein